MALVSRRRSEGILTAAPSRQEAPVGNIGRFVVLMGIALVLVGAVMWAAGRMGLGSLPGDVRLGGQGWSCYLPIVTSLLLSIGLTVVLNLLLRWFGR